MCVFTCSSDEAKTKLPHKVSASLAQALEKLDISNRAEKEKKGQRVCVCFILKPAIVAFPSCFWPVLNTSLTCKKMQSYLKKS